MTTHRRVEVNYTVGLEESPNVESITTNCQNSFVLNDNYQLDRVLQDEFQELAEVRLSIKRTEGELEWTGFLADNIPASALFSYLRPYAQKPSPPPSMPPPPLAPCTPSSPPPSPAAPSAEDIANGFKRELARLQSREVQLLDDISGCVGSRTRSCGISAIEGPNPWLAKDGTPCRGHSTLSARVGDFCGCAPATLQPSNPIFACTWLDLHYRPRHAYSTSFDSLSLSLWAGTGTPRCAAPTPPPSPPHPHPVTPVPNLSPNMFSRAQYNVDAANPDEKAELLEAGPWCFGDDAGTTALECDGRAQRTQRAGVWEMRVRRF